MIIKSDEAEKFQQPGVKGKKYSLNNKFFKQCFVSGELDGEHGERTSTDNPRLYYVVSGNGKFEIDGEVTMVDEGDLVLIPPKTKHNYWSGSKTLKFVLVMETH
jgi:quercetin dioxygenase-like cupin family protein